MRRFLRTVLAALVLLAIGVTSAIAQGSAPPGGLVITNQAHASYSDPSGNNYEANSPPVSITVVAVGGVIVTPDDQNPTSIIVANDRTTRVFRACNIGNAPDSYVMTKGIIPAPSTIESFYWDIDNSGSYTAGDVPVTLNSTESPILQPGQCINIIAVINTGAVTTDSIVPINITVKGKLPGTASQDDGTIITRVGESPRATDPNNPSLPPVKLVENRDLFVTSPGSLVNYSIAFRNRGAVAAVNVLLSDDLPAELDYVPGTMKWGTKQLTDAADSDEGQIVAGRRLEVRFPKIDPDEVVTVTFQARLNSTVIAGVAVINTALVAGDNIGIAVKTSKTKVVINPFGTVYDGYSDGSVIIPSAQVALTADQAGKIPVGLSGSGFDPNAQNGNPFATDANGHFSFSLASNLVGSPGSPVTYYIQVAAPGYRPRILEVRIEPTANDLFKVDVRGVDGQPISKAGSFALTDSAVSLPEIAALVLNIPLFASSSLQVSKFADKQRADVGDVITYRLDITNPTALTITGVDIIDTPPLSFSYVPGTARLQMDGAIAVAVEPTIAGNQLTFKLGTFAPGARASLSYRLRIGANARQGEQINSAFAEGRYPSGDPIRTPPVKASVYVGLGAFSLRQVILGRVFDDTNGNGLFEKCDRAVAGVRVYLNNGMSVITDSHGMYNFPSIEDGAAVVSLDPVTVPKGYGLLDNRLKSGRSWARLVRTPLNGGGMSRVNFALEKITNPITDAMTDIGDSAGAAGNGSSATTVSGSEKGETVETPTPAGAMRRPGEDAPGGALDGLLDRIRAPKTRAGVTAVNVGKSNHRAPGTYTESATDTVDPVAPGAIKVLSPEPGEVIMENGLRVEARVHLDFGVGIEVDGQRIPETNVAVKEVDRKNKVTTFAFVGISLKPGPNQLRIWATGPTGEKGQTVEMTVMGRGPATRLEITSEKKEVQSGGRDSTHLRIRAFDAWENPAAGGQVGVQVSAGRLLRIESARPVRAEKDQTPGDAETKTLPATGTRCSGGSSSNIDGSPCADSLAAAKGITRDEAKKILNSPLLGAGTEPVNGFSAEQVNATNRQQIVSLEAGEAAIELIGEGQPGLAEIRAFSGDLRAETTVRIIPEQRPQILVGVAEASIGRASPDIVSSGDERSYRHHTEFYFRGPLPASSQLTLAYSSFRPLNRTAGRDRRFFLDPLDRVYPVFGDSSTRFEDAQSNSKLYARIDRGRSYAMFGDFDAGRQEYVSIPYTATPVTNLAENLASAGIGNSVLNNLNSIPVFAGQGPQLTGYNRRLTGIKLHLEGADGSSITLTGARPDTAFARDIFPGSSFGLLQLSHADVLQGSETIVREVRDRRNPDLILQREVLVRSVDYNLDSLVGAIYFMRPLSTFDFALNLVQIVATYEYQAVGMNSAVYTARGSKNFNSLGLRVGTSFVDQRQETFGSFYLGGVDIEKKFGKSGTLQVEWGISNGRVASSGTYFGFDGLAGSLGSGNNEHNGHAFRAEYVQNLGFSEARLQASFAKSDQSFFNPFGATITPGSQRGSVALDLKPTKSSQMRVGFTDEMNQTATFDNHRMTASIGWIQQFGDKLRISAGYDFRDFKDQSGTALANSANSAAGQPAATASQFAGREVISNLITVGAEYRPNDKTAIAVKREQNLGGADPTYPDQTTVTASYQLNSLAKLFFTQRLASQSITAISDISAAGFAATASRRETAIGVESPLNKYTTMSGRYQIDNGINGTDSFAVIGLLNRFPISKILSIDAGYERGIHIKGNGDSFNNAMFGFSYNPTDSFRSAARYELRDMYGFGNIFTVGAAGRLSAGLTTLGRFQLSRTSFQNQGSNSMMNGQLAAAWRPLDSDRTAFLFSYTHRSIEQGGRSGFQSAIDRDDILSGDGLYQPFRRLELYGRYALKFNSSGRDGLPLVSTMTMLAQGRAELRFAKYFDLAGEVRSLWLSSSASRRDSIGAELGFWILSDLRLGGGYNFTRMREDAGYFGGIGSRSNLNTRKGFYFVVTSKLSNMFNLFGTSSEGLPGHEPVVTSTPASPSKPATEVTPPVRR